MIYLRQSYKIKPQRWGSDLDVRASIFQNAERIGIDPGSIALAMPMWEMSGNPKSYGNIATTPTLNNSAWVRDGIRCNADTEYIILAPATILPSAGTLLMHMDLLTRADARRYYWAVNSYSAFSILNNGTAHYIYCNGPYFSFSFDNPSNGWHSIAFSWDVAKSSRKFYFDGILINTNTDVFSLPTLSTVGNLTTGGLYSSTLRSLYGDVKSNYLINSVINPNQVAYLHDNPYFLLQRVAPVYFSLPSGGETPTYKPQVFMNSYRQRRSA